MNEELLPADTLDAFFTVHGNGVRVPVVKGCLPVYGIIVFCLTLYGLDTGILRRNPDGAELVGKLDDMSLKQLVHKLEIDIADNGSVVRTGAGNAAQKGIMVPAGIKPCVPGTDTMGYLMTLAASLQDSISELLVVIHFSRGLEDSCHRWHCCSHLLEEEP